MARRFDAAFKPVGITSGQFSLLMALNRPSPPTNGQVAATLGMDRTTLTAAVKPLVSRGLMEIRIDADDGRSRRLCLTMTGRHALAAALPIWRSVHAEIDAQGVMSGLPAQLRDLEMRA